MFDQIDVNGGAREQAGCRDQIALDDSRIPNSHLARGEGMGCEATPVTEETHLASPTLLAQSGLICNREDPELPNLHSVRRSDRPKRSTRA